VLLTLISAASLAIWLYLIFARGAFWWLHDFDADRENIPAPANWPTVIAIVPARNEAATIEESVASLVRQNYPGKFHIIVVDDHSDDGTAEIALRSASAENKPANNAPTRVNVLPASPLPPEWTGKVWALNEGLKSTEASPPDYYWFTDADIVHSPGTLQQLVARAEGNTLNLTSLMVLLQAKTFAERALIPAFLYFFLQLYPPRWIVQPRARTAGAAGGCILLRASALSKIGGLSTIAGEVIDDCALAKRVKNSGGRIWMGLARSSLSLRSYESWIELRDMIARTAFTQLNYSAAILIATLLGLILTFFAPVLLLLSANSATHYLALAAFAFMTISYLPAIRFYRLSPLRALTLPFAALFYFYATCLSAIRYWKGLGGQWKGRSAASRSL
jgi:hopene-associated glycosyltransferase HpnB